MFDRLIENGRFYGVKINVEKVRQPSPQQIMTDKREIIWNISSFWVVCQQMMQDVHVKLNPGLPWRKLQSTRRGLFSPTI
jgi:hypothetical protein